MNANSNNLTIISGYNSPNPVTTTIPSGGVGPELAFTFRTDNGFDNLAVGNTGNGVLAIFAGTPTGLVLQSQMAMWKLRHASCSNFSERPRIVSRSTSCKKQFRRRRGGPEPDRHPWVFPEPPDHGDIALVGDMAPSNGVAQLVPLQESSLALVGTLLPLSTHSSPVAALRARRDAQPPSVPPSTTAGSFGQPLLGEETDSRRRAGRTRADPRRRLSRQPAKSQCRWLAALHARHQGALDRFDREHPEPFHRRCSRRAVNQFRYRQNDAERPSPQTPSCGEPACDSEPPLERGRE